MTGFCIGFLVGVLATIFVGCCYRAWVLWPKVSVPHPDDIAHPANQPASNFTDAYNKASDAVNEVTQSIGQSTFAVSGKPTRVPWHIRKRQLTEAAKTKRRKLESFQEIDNG